ncbi:hypothetical protein N665_0473s0011 [Sinapis alba]|nr:hypothetical protein N665_0473s0011 [Sinapis alba]
MHFGWASRLVHYMLCFQLNIKKKYELWSLVGADPVRFSLIEFEQLTGLNCEYIENLENPRCEVTNEMTTFWERIGVYVDAGSSSEQIIRALKRSQKWSQDDRMRLGYLTIFSGFIEGRKYSSATRASLARCGSTMLCHNWVLIMGIPYQTNRLHRCWHSRVAKDANVLKTLSSDM